MLQKQLQIATAVDNLKADNSIGVCQQCRAAFVNVQAIINPCQCMVLCYGCASSWYVDRFHNCPSCNIEIQSVSRE